MRTYQTRWSAGEGWSGAGLGPLGDAAHLVLLFGGTAVLKDPARLREVTAAYPSAHLLGCSTAGEIAGTEVHDDGMVATAVAFDRSRIQGTAVRMADVANSVEAGERLAAGLDPEGLVHVFVISDGLAVNGSDLVSGLARRLPANVTITGGLAGDAARFQETVVVWDGEAQSGTVAALGLYGDGLRIGYGSLGGWDAFGNERLVTRSVGNVLYELDGQSALALYKTYLGEHAAGLPATGLLFPLTLRTDADETPVVRTILAVDEAAQSITFAGDVPQGAHVRLMKANFDRLIDGATGAARTTTQALGSATPELAVLISCVGRKLILKQRVEEEVEGVRDVLGDGATMTGFYSYGEISPFVPGARCELHNQTMTITTFAEA